MLEEVQSVRLEAADLELRLDAGKLSLSSNSFLSNLTKSKILQHSKILTMFL